MFPSDWIDAYIRYDQAVTQYAINEFERRTTMEDKKETLQKKIDQFNETYRSCVFEFGTGCKMRGTVEDVTDCATLRVKVSELRLVKECFNNNCPVAPRIMMSMAIDIATGNDTVGQPGTVIRICSGFWRLICEIQDELWASQYEYRTEETEVDPLDKMLEEVLEVDKHCTSFTGEVTTCPIIESKVHCWDREVSWGMYSRVIEAFRNKRPMSDEARAMFENPSIGHYHGLKICQEYVRKILSLDDALREKWNENTADTCESCDGCSACGACTTCTDERIAELTKKVRELSQYCSGERFDPSRCPGNYEVGYDRCMAYCVSKKAYNRAIALLLDGRPMTHEVLVAFFGEYDPNSIDEDGAIFLCTPYFKAIKKLNQALLEKRFEETAPKVDVQKALEDVKIGVENLKEALLAGGEAIKNALEKQ